MADVKWIKITTDMFEDEKIDFIISLPESDAILVIWIRLLALAGKCNAGGYIYLTEKIPYTEDMLSHKFRKPINIVKLALDTFRKLGMMDFDENGIFLPNWDKHQNVEGLEKIRKQARLRQQKRRLSLTNANPVLERDKNICQYCGMEATGVDHIIPVSKGGTNDEGNLVAACKECNNHKMIQKLDDFLNWHNHEGKLRIDLVLGNPVLSKLVELNNGIFTMRHVTSCDNVTSGNATDIDKELDIELDKDIEEIPYGEIVAYLNSETGSKYKSSSSKTKSLIKARWNDGFRLDDFKAVIGKKCSSWLNNVEMVNYLRPETLFGTKFESYLNEKIIPQSPPDDPGGKQINRPRSFDAIDQWYDMTKGMENK